MPNVSPHAVVEPTAQLADGVRVGAFTYIGPEVRIGQGCYIRIQDGAVIENMALQTKIEQLVNIGVDGRPAGVAAGNQENL